MIKSFLKPLKGLRNMTISIFSNLFTKVTIINNNFMGDMSIDEMLRVMKESHRDQVTITCPSLKQQKSHQAPDEVQETDDETKPQ